MSIGNDGNEPAARGEIVLYQIDDGRTRVECRFAGESIWLTQRLMAELFQVTPQNITLHLKAIYEEGELDESVTCKEYLQVQSEGGRKVSRALLHYNLDAILAVGYRVRSRRGDRLLPVGDGAPERVFPRAYAGFITCSVTPVTRSFTCSR